MKLTGAKIAGFLKSPPGSIKIILVYGPDGGLVRERLKTLAQTVCQDLSDPFRIVELQANAIKSDPALLADEAAALSFSGGRRVITIRDAGDAISAALIKYLEDPIGDALILLEGGELGPRSSLRKLMEGGDICAAVPCYSDEGRDLSGFIRETLNGHKLQITPDALAYLQNHLGSDRQVSRGELDKLALYMGQDQQVTLDHAIACIGDSGAFSLDNVTQACANGDFAALEQSLSRCFGEGIQPIAILRALARYFHRLHLSAGYISAGENPDNAINKLKPPVIFKQKDALKSQLSRWQLGKIGQALEIITTAEGDCKITGLPAETICSRALMRIAQAARAGNRR